MGGLFFGTEADNSRFGGYCACLPQKCVNETAMRCYRASFALETLSGLLVEEALMLLVRMGSARLSI